jgi:hypothetical protein
VDPHETISATTRAETAPTRRVSRMWYVGGLAIGIVLVVVLVMAAAKTMRKR